MSLASELVCLSVPTALLLLLLLLGWLNLSDHSPDGTEHSAAQEEGRLGESKSHGSVVLALCLLLDVPPWLHGRLR